MKRKSPTNQCLDILLQKNFREMCSPIYYIKVLHTDKRQMKMIILPQL